MGDYRKRIVATLAPGTDYAVTSAASGNFGRRFVWEHATDVSSEGTPHENERHWRAIAVPDGDEGDVPALQAADEQRGEAGEVVEFKPGEQSRTAERYAADKAKPGKTSGEQKRKGDKRTTRANPAVRPITDDPPVE